MRVTGRQRLARSHSKPVAVAACTHRGPLQRQEVIVTGRQRLASGNSSMEQWQLVVIGWPADARGKSKGPIMPGADSKQEQHGPKGAGRVLDAMPTAEVRLA